MRLIGLALVLALSLVLAPLAGEAQQSDRVRRVGVLMGFAENDQVWQVYLAAIKQRLQEHGWTDGRNIRIEYRYAGENTESIRIAAVELVTRAPAAILVSTNQAVAA